MIHIVDELYDDLNHEVSQSTNQILLDKFEYEEKEYLRELPANLLDPFFEEDIIRVVSKESMVNFRKCKYSVDPRYIGRTVNIELSDNACQLQIYYNGEPICSHDITTRALNYHEDDRIKILKSDLLKGRNDKVFIAENLSQYDEV